MNSIGSMILEELAERHQSLSELRDAIGSDDATLCEYLDGRRSVLPVARLLARFFGTSVSLWKNTALSHSETVKKRSKNGQAGAPATARYIRYRTPTWKGDSKAVEAVEYLLSLGMNSDEFAQADAEESGDVE
jgi:plasmid maintenance system antidote protein VapI